MRRLGWGSPQPAEELRPAAPAAGRGLILPEGLDAFERRPRPKHEHRTIEHAFVSGALERIAAEGKESYPEVVEVYLAGRELPPSFQKNEGAAIGFILEALARQSLETLYPGSEIRHGAKLYDAAGKEVGELDGIVLDAEGRVIALAEMKISPGMVQKGRQKLETLLAGIQAGTLTHYAFSPGPRRSFDELGPLDRARFQGLGPESCFGMSVREAAPAPGVLRLSVSYRTIAKVASILTFYSGQKAPPPCLGSRLYPEKHPACGTQ